jgi:hypothetical protein
VTTSLWIAALRALLWLMHGKSLPRFWHLVLWALIVLELVQAVA